PVSFVSVIKDIVCDKLANFDPNVSSEDEIGVDEQLVVLLHKCLAHFGLTKETKALIRFQREFLSNHTDLVPHWKKFIIKSKQSPHIPVIDNDPAPTIYSIKSIFFFFYDLCFRRKMTNCFVIPSSLLLSPLLE
ncbi:hypothetical protein RFI_37161, partial [Reticulomyxa filosa]